MKIQTIVTNDNGEILGKREALSFESAEENLGKLERQFKMNEERCETCEWRSSEIGYWSPCPAHTKGTPDHDHKNESCRACELTIGSR